MKAEESNARARVFHRRQSLKTSLSALDSAHPTRSDEHVRILLAAAPHRDTFGYSMPPPGLLRLGGELERSGVDVALEDLAHRLSAGDLPDDDRLADAACEWIVTRGEFDVIGFSVMGATLPIALAILERVRARNGAVALWLGGPGTTGVDRALLARFPYIDAVVRGEGERTVREMCARVADAAHDAHVHECGSMLERGAQALGHAVLERGEVPPERARLLRDELARPRHDFSGVAGVTWRDHEGRVHREDDREPIQDLATLAPYARHLLPSIAEYKRVTGGADGLVPIDSGRGCAYDCSFCTIGRFWSRRSRTLPARLLADEVAALTAIEGAKSAYLCHDIFGANRGQAVAFCEEMLARGVRVPWEVRARADHLDRELLELMGRAGCYRVLIGVESADADVRERNQKGMRRAIDMLAVVDGCAAASITPILSLILGLPGEDEHALEASLDLCARAALRAGVNLSLHLVNPQPGCGLGEEFGVSARAIEGIPPDMAWGTGETAAERALIAAHPDLFSTFALLPQDEAHLRDLHAIASSLPEVLMRYPRTFALLREAPEGATRGALELYRAWKQSARSFEAFARAARSEIVDDMLAWEQALVRAAAQAGGRDVASGENSGDSCSETARDRACGPVAQASVERYRFDLPEVANGLRADERRARDPKATWLAVVAAPERSPMKGVETLRVSELVAAILTALDGTRTRDELERERPGLGQILEQLSSRGLVDLVEPAAIPTNVRHGP